LQEPFQTPGQALLLKWLCLCLGKLCQDAPEVQTRAPVDAYMCVCMCVCPCDFAYVCVYACVYVYVCARLTSLTHHTRAPFSYELGWVGMCV